MMKKQFKIQLIRFTLLLCCCLLAHATFCQTQTYTICVGDSVTLTRLSTPSGGGGPVGPYPSQGTSACSRLSRIIEPNDASVEPAGNKFVLFPKTTTTYTISSQYIGGPGSNCNPSDVETDIITIFVVDCTSPDEILTICRGEDITIDLNLNDFDYGDECFTCNAGSFESINWFSDGDNVSNGKILIVNPLETVFYTVDLIVYSNCNIDETCIPGGVLPPPTKRFTKVYQIEVIDCPQWTNTPNIFSICEGDTANVRQGNIAPLPPIEIALNESCDVFEKVIMPNNSSVKREGDNFMLFPERTTTYTIISSWGATGAGENCISTGASINTFLVEVVDNCEEEENNQADKSVSFSICSGESVMLSSQDLALPSPPPSSTSNQLYCNFLIKHISPNDASVERVDDGFILSPNTTTTYTVTSSYGAAGPGQTCNPSEKIITTIEVIVEECIPPGEVLTVCTGESTTINLNLQDFKFETGCFSCSAFRFEEINWIENGTNISNESSFTISPIQSTTYLLEVTIESGCNGVAGTTEPCGAAPIPYRSYSIIYQIEVIENCDPSYEPQIFIKYPWLNNIVDVNPTACAGTSIIEYDAGSYNFIHIKTGSGGSLYFENGTFYCEDQPGYSCVDAYNLTNIVDDSFSCDGSSNPGCTDPNASNYDAAATEDDGMCDYDPIENSIFSDYPWLSTLINQNNCSNESIILYDAGSYYFLEIKSGSSTELYYQNGTYYCTDAPGNSCANAYNLTNVSATWSCGIINNMVLGCTDTNATNYNPAATEDDGSCTFEIDCNKHQGTFFFQNCGGQNYYFIQLEDGRIFDPYFAEGINFIPIEGQQVSFDFVYNTQVTTPCTVSEAPITITCIEEVSGYPFEVYPWLSALVNSNNCNGETIRVYDAGSYNFITIQSNSGTDLYYQNGTFYCSDAPGYSCVQAYNLTNVVDTWSCGNDPVVVEGCTDANANNYNSSATIDDGTCTYNNTIDFDFADYPWLDTIVNPFNCNDELQITEYDFGHYAFIHIKTIDGGSLYLNNGTFYCSDNDGQTCLNSYRLTTTSTAWVCSDGGFQQFDYVYAICEGESITLTPNYETVSVNCQCTPCPPVGPPGPPIVIWTPASACSSECFSTTVSPSATTTYASVASAVQFGTTGCGAPGPAGQQTITKFLVFVEPCAPAKTSTDENTQKIAAPKFHMYPNPTTNIVFVELPTKAIYQISLLDVSGKVMKQVESNLDVSIIEMNVQDIPKGMYLMAIQNESQQTVQKLIIK